MSCLENQEWGGLIYFCEANHPLIYTNHHFQWHINKKVTATLQKHKVPNSNTHDIHNFVLIKSVKCSTCKIDRVSTGTADFSQSNTL